MQDDYSKKIDLAMLEKKSDLSKSQINRRFRKETGKTAIQYLQGIRIEAAKTLLFESEEPINIIATRCGFRSSIHFINVFKESRKIRRMLLNWVSSCPNVKTGI